MKKVLISTLGRGQREGDRYDYKEGVYLLPDGSEVRTKLVSRALIDYIKPDEIYILGTKESLWNLADELIGNYRKVVIPYGKSKEEFWEMFRIINSEVDVSGKDIYLDITHGFRAIPLLVSTVANLFSKVKGATVKGIFYGIFEAKDYKGRTPVVDLLPILELSEWIEGFTLFKNYGDGDFLAELIDRKLSGLKPELRREVGDLKKLSKLLRKYSQAVGFTAVNFIPKFTGQVVQLVNNIKSVPSDFNSVELLKASLNETYEEVKNEDAEEWKNQYKIAKWLFNKRRYSQATIALEECIFTYVLEKLGIDTLNQDLRKKLGGVFNKDRSQHEIFSRELNALFGKIQDLRNKTGHAFMRKEVVERDIKYAIDKLKNYIEETYKVLTDGNADNIKNPEKLIKYLGFSK